MELNAASQSDLRDCAALMAASSPWAEQGYQIDRCMKELAAESVAVSVCREQGKLVAFCAEMEHGFGLEPLLLFLCTRESERGKGYGAALLSRFETARERGYLTVTETNPALCWYLRRGWEQVGLLGDHDTPGVSEIILRWRRHTK